MSKRKTTVFITALLLILCLLSSCGSKEKASDEPTKEPTYKHEEFVYDESINWNSSYTDIIKKYGKPDQAYSISDGDYRISYNNPNISNYTFYSREFAFNQNTGRLWLILIDSKYPLYMGEPTEKDKKIASDIKRILISKYGEPDTIEDEEEYWKHIFAETEIMLWNNENGYTLIRYTNEHNYSDEEPYTDLPTPEPKPTSTPVNATGL